MSGDCGDYLLINLLGVRSWLLAGTTVMLAAGIAGAAGSANAGVGGLSQRAGKTPATYKILRQDVIINADIWARKPEMMAAGLGFTNIVGVQRARQDRPAELDWQPVGVVDVLAVVSPHA